MARKNRADSTEELLDIIRSEDERQLNFKEESAQTDPKKGSDFFAGLGQKDTLPRTRPALLVSKGRVKNPVLGVDVGHGSLTVVAVSSAEPKRLLDVRSIPYAPEDRPGTPGFGALLRSTLDNISAGRKEVWALLGSGDVDVNVVEIPRVAASKRANTVYWQLQKERRFDAAEFVLDYQVQGQRKDAGVAKSEVLTCLARREDVDRLVDVFSAAGCPLAGVTIIPCAFQNIYRAGWVASGQGLTASLHVARSFSCITIYEGSNIHFSRTIKFGMDSLASELADAYNEGLVDKGRKSGRNMDLETARLLLNAKLFQGEAPHGVPGENMTEQGVFDAVRVSLERVARQAERTLEFYAQNHHQRCGHLHLSGRIFGNQLVTDYVSSELALETSLFDPMGRQAALLAPSLRGYDERIALSEACGVALSGPGTINLSTNYAVRAQEKRKSWARKAVLLGAVVLAMLLGGFWLLGQQSLKARNLALQNLMTQLGSGPVVDEAALASMAAQVAQHQDKMRRVASRYEALAVFNELSRLTPPGARLTSVSMDLFGTDATPVKAAAAGGEVAPVRLLIIEGLVVGGERDYEAGLTRLLMGLKSSPLFGEAVVSEKTTQQFVPEGEVLRFVLHVQLK